MAADLGVVGRIGAPTVVREERDVVARGKMAQQVVGANFAAGVDGQELAGFDPQKLHIFHLSKRSATGPTHRSAPTVRRDGPMCPPRRAPTVRRGGPMCPPLTDEP